MALLAALFIQAACGFVIAAGNTAQPQPPDEPLPPGATARFGSLKWRMPSSNPFDIAISPDGTRVAVSANGAVAVWDVPGNRELYYLPAPDTLSGAAIAISPDGRLLAVAMEEAPAAVRILDLETGKQKSRVATNVRWITEMAFSPDGKKLITGGYEDPTIVWELATGKKLREFPNEGRSFFPFALSPNGRWLAVAEDRAAVTIIDFATGRKLHRLQTFPGIARMAFSPDNRSLMVSGNKTRKLYEAATGKVRLEIPVDLPRKLFQFSQDGKKLAVSGGHSVDWLDPFTGQMIGSWKGHRSMVTEFAISQDGSTAVSCTSDGNVHVWNVASGEIMRAPDGLAGSCDLLAFGDDDKTILAGGLDFHFLNAKTFKAHAHLPLNSSRDQRQVIGLSPNRKTIAYWQENRTIAIIDVPGRKVACTIKCPNWAATSFAFAPDSKTLHGLGIPVASKPESNLLPRSRVWNVATGDELKPVHEDLRFCNEIAISRHGKLAAVFERNIRVWDLNTGKEEVALKCDAFNLLFSYDGNFLATKLVFHPLFAQLSDQNITLWDFKKRTELLRFKESAAEVCSWCFSHDDQILTLGHDDGSITFWSIPAGKKLAELPAHRGPVTALAFSHDGETLVTGSSDGTILKWPAKNWRAK